MVGRLLGATEMVALHLQLSKEPFWQAMGDHLDTVAGWFVEGVDERPPRRPVRRPNPVRHGASAFPRCRGRSAPR